MDNAYGASISLLNSADLSSDLEIGATYKLLISAYYTGGAAGPRIRLYDGNSTQTTDQITGSKVVYSLYFKAYSDTSAFLGCSGMGTGNVVYIDNLSLKKLHDFSANDVIVIGGVPDGEAVGAELVTNGDVESDIPTMNGVSNTHSACNVAKDSADGIKHSGSNSLKMVSTSDVNSMVYYYADGSNCGLTSGELYYCAVWVYIPSGNTTVTTANLYYRPKDGDSVLLDTTSLQDTWVKLEGVFTDNDSERVMYLHSPGDENTSGDIIYWDDFVVAKKIEIQAKPYRIASIDSEGVVTLADADFSDLAASTTGYACSADFKNYSVSNGGWMPGVDVDYTVIDSGTLTEGEVYFIITTETDNFYTDCEAYEFFTSVGTETCDANNTVFHITDTYAKCDGSNTQASYLMSNEFTITQNRGYNVAYDITSIDAGGLTPVVGLKEGTEIIAAPIDSSQNIKGLGTGDDAGLKAATGTECVVNELTIYEYQ